VEVVDRLRREFPRFVTVLEDVIIAGPPAVQAIVDEYWLRRLRRNEVDDRTRLGQLERALAKAENPPPALAAKRLAKAIAPDPVKKLYYDVRGALRPDAMRRATGP